MLGSGAMTNSIDDVCRKADVVMLVGSNPEEAHPVIGMQLRAAVERGCRLIVVDPRDIGLATQADLHLKLRPGTNVAFANGIVNVLLAEGLYDAEFVRERTEGIEVWPPRCATTRPRAWPRSAASTSATSCPPRRCTEGRARPPSCTAWA